jgi:hypothetical protein
MDQLSDNTKNVVFLIEVAVPIDNNAQKNTHTRDEQIHECLLNYYSKHGNLNAFALHQYDMRN